MRTLPNVSRWSIRWREPLSIVSTTLSFLVLVILVLFSVVAWNAWSDYRLLNENVHLAQIASDLLSASDQFAAERGFTAAALNTSLTERHTLIEKLGKYRKTSDTYFADAVNGITQFKESHTHNVIFDLGLLHIEEAKQQIAELRKKVDSVFNGNSHQITTEEWFRGMSDTILHVQHVRELVMADQFITHSSASGYKTVRDWTWIISENMGRERALLATYLMTGTPIPEDAVFELNAYRHEIEHRLEMLNDLNGLDYIDPRILQSIQDINKALSGPYSDVRSSIYQNADSANYSVSGQQWMNAATRAIEAVLNLSKLSSEIIQADIDREKLNRLLTIFLLLLLSPLIILLLTKGTQKTRDATKALIAAKQSAEHNSENLKKEVVWREQIQEKLRLSEQSFLMLVMQNPVGIAVTGSDGACLFINSAGEKMLNQKMGEVITNKALLLTPPGSRMEIDIHHDEHTFGTAEGQICETIWKNKKERLILLNDITSRKTVESEVAHMTYHDKLTGLANRVLFGSRLEHAINRARRKGSMVAVLFVDIDKFKVINDTLGHSIGDELLGRVAGKLLGCVRDYDTVGRMGGDEFIVLIEDLDPADEADAVAAKIQFALSEKFIIQRHFLNISASIGISIYPRDTDNPDMLIQSADTAMFHAKEKGRGNVVHYNPKMGERFSERLELESCMHSAVNQKEFEIYYQPMVDANNKRVIGAEALLRWNHPLRGAVSPEEFIPVLEDMKLIIPLGKWILERVCAQNKAWQDSGLTPIVTSVNLSPVQLVLESLEKELNEILENTRLSPEYLELEITETALMQSPESCARTLQQIKAMGIHIAIDDFGTGYSSLSHLKTLPINKLKIDRSFVMDIPDDTDDMSITQAIISLTQNLNLDVIAEGVETAIQLEFLKENGCDNVQGFYFSQPLTAIQFEALLKEQSRDDELPNKRLAML